jgi:hypothetical protein
VYLIYTYTCAGRQAHNNTTRKYTTITATNTQNAGGLLNNAAESILLIVTLITHRAFFIVCSFCLNPFFLVRLLNPFFRDICLLDIVGKRNRILYLFLYTYTGRTQHLNAYRGLSSMNSSSPAPSTEADSASKCACVINVFFSY